MVSKILFLGIISLFLISFVAGVVSSAPDAETVAQDATDAGKAIGAGASGFIFGIKEGIGNVAGELFTEQAWATRMLFAILLYMVIYSVITTIFTKKTLGGRNVAGAFVSLIITAIVFMTLPSDFLEAIALQYGAMGAAILSVIPFMIMLVFTVRVQSALVARVLWFFYCIYYFGLYIYAIWVAPSSGAETLPYLLALIAGICIFFGIGMIRDLLFKGKMEAVREQGVHVARKARLLHELQDRELKESYSDVGN